MSDWNGVPMHPERHGTHWIAIEGEIAVWEWNAMLQAWHAAEFGRPDTTWPPSKLIEEGFTDYLGPCLTPSEVTALQAAAWRAGRDAAVEEAAYLLAAWRKEPGQRNGVAYAETIIALIRALQPPGDLAAAQEGRSDGE